MSNFSFSVKNVCKSKLTINYVIKPAKLDERLSKKSLEVVDYDWSSEWCSMKKE